MVADSNLHGPSLEAIVEQIHDELAGEPLIGYPDDTLVSAVVHTHYTSETSGARLLLTEATEQSALDDFLTASKLAELAADGINVRITTEERSVAVTDGERVIVPVGVPEQAAGLVDTDEVFVEALTDAYENAWADASPFEPATPPLDRLLSELAAITSDDLKTDFEAVLAASDAIGERDDPIDVVMLALLVGARHGVQLYELSEWGDQTGLASKATFSRKKSVLEEQGLIETESIPIDVGRPRLQLHVADTGLDELNPADFLDEVRSRLSE